MLSSMIPIEATHSSLDLFERPALLVSFDKSFEQRVGCSSTPNGATLDFQVIGDRNNFIDLSKIFLAVQCTILQTNGDPLKYDSTAATDNTKTDTPNFINNTLHSLFSDCDVFANGTKVSTTNGMYAHKCFVETEMSFGKDAKDTWLSCQGYQYEDNPGDRTTNAITERIKATRTSSNIIMYGKLAVDFFTCEKLLLPNVNLRIRLVRSQNDFVIVSEDASKHYQAVISDVNLFVRKMSVSENVVEALENALQLNPAIYKYNEVIPKTFVIPNGVYSWRYDNLFTNEPIRRVAIALNYNDAFGNKNDANPLHYRKLGMQSITITRGSDTIAGTPLDLRDNKRAYFNTLAALGFTDQGHGIPLSEYENHYVLVFDLTSTQEASQEYLFPELTNASVAIDIQFSTPTARAVEILVIGEKSSSIYINKDRKVSKNILMDNE